VIVSHDWKPKSNRAGRLLESLPARNGDSMRAFVLIGLMVVGCGGDSSKDKKALHDINNNIDLLNGKMVGRKSELDSKTPDHNGDYINDPVYQDLQKKIIRAKAEREMIYAEHPEWKR